MALTVAVPPTLQLAAVPATRPVRLWMMDEPSPLPAHPVQLPRVGLVNGADTFRLALTPRDVDTFAQNDRVMLMLGKNNLMFAPAF